MSFENRAPGLFADRRAPTFPGRTMSALAWHRYQFAFTITYHYLFPQLTMGLALLIVVFKVLALREKRRALRRPRALLGARSSRSTSPWAS